MPNVEVEKQIQILFFFPTQGFRRLAEQHFERGVTVMEE